MAITFTGAGGLFTQLGKFGRLANMLNRFAGDSSITFGGSEIITDLTTEFDLLKAEFDGSPFAITQSIDGMHADVTTQISSFSNLLKKIQTAAQNVIINTVLADTALSAATIDAALAELIAQMEDGAYYVSSPTVTAGGGPGTNTGDGTLVTSLLDPFGRTTLNALAESLIASVTTGDTLGSERLQIVGSRAARDSMLYDWPKGSGATLTVASVVAGGSASKITNGTFEAFTVANVPDNWTIDVGTAGTTVKKSTAVKFAGASSLEIDGNGAELTALSQTLTGLAAKTPYAVAFSAKVSAVPAAGVLTVDLWDGAAVINNEAGNPNSFTVSLPGLTTSFGWVTGSFRLPEPLPATITLRLRLTTALSNTKNLFVDNLSLTPMTELYAGGPWVAAVSGSVPFSTDDLFGIDIANNRAGKWQEFFNRVCGMAGRRLLLPASGTTLIADSLLG